MRFLFVFAGLNGLGRRELRVFDRTCLRMELNCLAVKFMGCLIEDDLV